MKKKLSGRSRKAGIESSTGGSPAAFASPATQPPRRPFAVTEEGPLTPSSVTAGWAKNRRPPVAEISSVLRSTETSDLPSGQSRRLRLRQAFPSPETQRQLPPGLRGYGGTEDGKADLGLPGDTGRTSR